MAEVEKSQLFLSVIESHKGIIYRIAKSYSNNNDDRNDLVQEIILKLWQAFDTYNDEYKHSTWIYRVALNTAISNFRKEKVREKYLKSISPSYLDFDEEDKTEEKEKNYILLEQFIAELNKLDKALMLLYLEEKKHKEIAEILGISESNVGTKISRIKTLLKQNFSKIK